MMKHLSTTVDDRLRGGVSVFAGRYTPRIAEWIHPKIASWISNKLEHNVGDAQDRTLFLTVTWSYNVAREAVISGSLHGSPARGAFVIQSGHELVSIEHNERWFSKRLRKPSNPWLKDGEYAYDDEMLKKIIEEHAGKIPVYADLRYRSSDEVSS
jgi:hypothetical protein